MGNAKPRGAVVPDIRVTSTSEDPGDDRHARPSIVTGKSCGSCTKCCTVLGVAELKKPAWDDCPHIAAGFGCKIYSDRPSSCRHFTCGWLLDPDMGLDLKPENCHVVFYQQGEHHIVATCDAAYPDAWRQPNVSELLYRLAGSLGPHRKVIVVEEDQTWYVTERGIVPVDIG